MNDCELLELAAKAAGIEGGWGPVFKIGDDEVDVSDIWFLDAPETGSIWDPLTDDGDALRLAVKLHMTVDIFTGGCEVGYDDMKGGQGYLRQDDGPSGDMDDFEVVRRAIVRAAAEMGRVE